MEHIPVLLAYGADRAIRRAARPLARRAPGRTPLVDEGRQAGRLRGPDRPSEASPDRRRAHRPQRHSTVGATAGPCAHPGAWSGARMSESASPPQTPEADGVPSVLIPHGHYRTWFERMPHAATVPGQFGYVGLIKPYKGVEHLVDAYAAASAIDPTLTLRISGKPVDEGIERRLRAATARLDGLETTLRYVGEAGVRRGGDVERTRRAALPVHAQLGDRPGGALPRASHPRARQRRQSRTLVGSGPGLGAPVRWGTHGRRTARCNACATGRSARSSSRPQRSGVG